MRDFVYGIIFVIALVMAVLSRVAYMIAEGAPDERKGVVYAAMADLISMFLFMLIVRHFSA